MKCLSISFLALIAFIGCDQEKASNAVKNNVSKLTVVKDRVSELTTEYEEVKVLAHADAFIKAVEACDLQKLKSLCTECGNVDYRTIMTCYYNVFAIENAQGVDAARRYINDEMAKADNPPGKDKALKAMNKYFEAKGSLRTKEVAGLILIIGLEVQYPHRGAVLGSIIADKLGLMDMSKQPQASQSSAATDTAPGT